LKFWIFGVEWASSIYDWYCFREFNIGARNSILPKS
jgi:hypothetical protein